MNAHDIEELLIQRLVDNSRDLAWYRAEVQLAMDAHRRAVMEECRKMIQKVECGDLESPQLIAGTDHRPEELRCLREGIMAGLQGAYSAIK